MSKFFALRMVSGLAGGFSMGTVYAYASSNSLPVRPSNPPACDKVLYAIADEPTYWGIGMGVAAAAGGIWPIIGLTCGTYQATTEEHGVLRQARSLWLAVRDGGQ
eukprot:TRINITY_DN834_c0_g5_i1.p1 TRINITY_DN834_c0_g5~~TRINITY_DN834_c0_g5_i1.p1  ORF type:complete len:123 (+),score=24.95 TRINITY_DN834_c0_g5_i1:55-369(+)